MSDPIFIECQTCGEVLRRIQFNQPSYNKIKEDMIARPYSYVLYCKPCLSEGLHIEQEYL